MDPQQLPKTSKFYSRCKKCDIEKLVGSGYHHHPLGSLKVNVDLNNIQRLMFLTKRLTISTAMSFQSNVPSNARLLLYVRLLVQSSHRHDLRAQGHSSGTPPPDFSTGDFPLTLSPIQLLFKLIRYFINPTVMKQKMSLTSETSI